MRICGQQLLQLLFVLRISYIEQHLPQAALEPVHIPRLDLGWGDQVDPIVRDKGQEFRILYRQHLVDAHGGIPRFRAEQEHQRDHRQQAVPLVETAQVLSRPYPDICLSSAHRPCIMLSILFCRVAMRSRCLFHLRRVLQGIIDHVPHGHRVMDP